ncbi:MAG: guanylate kinase [Gammaproteobacteria bacterium]
MFKQLRIWWKKLMLSDTAPRLFVIAAPSGAGKTSLVKQLLRKHANLRMSVSFTTRPQRTNEVPGQDYWFVSVDEFGELEQRDDLLEHAQVFDNFYGTGRSQVQKLFDDGFDVLLEIDWQGARQVRKAMPESVSIFILPPSRDELERRLRGRSTDSADVIQRRLRDSVSDMSHWNEFDYVIVNDDFNSAVNDLSEIVEDRGDALLSSRESLGALLDDLLHS